LPCPLPPLGHNKPETPRLSFLKSPKIAEPLRAEKSKFHSAYSTWNLFQNKNGTPLSANVIQLHAEFDPVIEFEGHWKYLQFPQKIEFDDYTQFERFCKKHLPVPTEGFDYLMDYIHNFQVVNIDLATGEVYPVIPRPSGFDVPIPLVGAPGPYLGGGGT
jgi:hypothetical protein